MPDLVALALPLSGQTGLRQDLRVVPPLESGALVVDIPLSSASTTTWTTVLGPRSPETESLAYTETLIVLEGLQRALRGRIYTEDDVIAVEDADTGIFGSATTLHAAVVDLREALGEHLAVLAGDDALSESLQHQLKLLRSYFNTP